MCGETCAKIVLIVFNCIFLNSGFGVLTMGLYVRFQKTQFDALIGTTIMTTTTYVMIAAGGVVMMVSVVGFLGAVTKNRHLLFVYSMLLMLTFLMEGAAGILGFYCHDIVKEILAENVKFNMLERYGFTGNKHLNSAVDYMQQELQCCGYEDSVDWASSMYYTDTRPGIVEARGSSKLPISCCVNINKPNCNSNFDENIFSAACYSKLETLFQQNLKLLGAVGVGVSLLQLVGMVLSLLLIKKSKEDEMEF